MKNEEIAKALRACDWSNIDIGNKTILSAAILALESSLPQGGEAKAVGTFVGLWGSDGLIKWEKPFNYTEPIPINIGDKLYAAPVAQTLPIACNHIFEAKPKAGCSEHTGPFVAVCKYCGNTQGEK